MQVQYTFDGGRMLVVAPPGSIVVLFEPHEHEQTLIALSAIQEQNPVLDHVIGLLTKYGSVL
jgi:hypothetical protein